MVARAAFDAARIKAGCRIESLSLATGIAVAHAWQHSGWRKHQ
jgi:hypothetical protein